MKKVHISREWFSRGSQAILPLRPKWFAGMQNNLMGTFRQAARVWKHISLGSSIEMVISDALNTPAEKRFNSCIRKIYIDSLVSLGGIKSRELLKL